MNKSIQNILKHKDFLNLLANAKPKYRKSLIKSADKQFIKAICEGTLNLLNGNIPLSEEDKILLNKYKSKLRKLIKKSNIEDKKIILNQRGGFLNILLPAIIGGLASVVNNIVDKSFSNNQE
jgi:hypothetical protein